MLLCILGPWQLNLHTKRGREEKVCGVGRPALNNSMYFKKYFEMQFYGVFGVFIVYLWWYFRK
jgi:hypothetical protein